MMDKYNCNVMLVSKSFDQTHLFTVICIERTFLKTSSNLLKSIDDNYPKIILSLDGVVRDVPDGFIHRNVIEWLLS